MLFHVILRVWHPVFTFIFGTLYLPLSPQRFSLRTQPNFLWFLPSNYPRVIRNSASRAPPSKTQDER
jgi:hypothetical protein